MSHKHPTTVVQMLIFELLKGLQVTLCGHSNIWHVSPFFAGNMVRTFGLNTLVTTIFVVTIVAVPLAAPPVFADKINNPRIKRIYTAEDAPLEIRFRKLLTMLTLSPDESRDRGNRQLQGLGIASQDILAVRAYLGSLYEQAQAEIDEGIWRIACHSNASSLGGLEIRVVYNSFDELRYAVAAKYLAIASAEMASKGYPDFLNMIEGYPGSSTSFTVISTDHRLAWGEDDYGIQESRTAACRGISERLGKHPN